MQRLTKSQSLFYGETEAKRTRICSTTRRRADSKAIEEFSKACKGSPGLKTCFIARQKPSVPGSTRPHEGQQTAKQSKNFLRHAKAHQVSKPVLRRDRSQACQDLLDHAKASRLQSNRRTFLRHAKAHQASNLVLWRDRSQACQDLLNHAKASRLQSNRRIF